MSDQIISDFKPIEIVALRLIPATQCTKTFSFLIRRWSM